MKLPKLYITLTLSLIKLGHDVMVDLLPSEIGDNAKRRPPTASAWLFSPVLVIRLEMTNMILP